MRKVNIIIAILSLIAVRNLSAQITVMPLGDSITYDNRINENRPVGQRTAYRQQLWLDLQASGYAVDFVGSQIAGQDADPPFDPDNEGHPGWHADGDPADTSIASHIYVWLKNLYDEGHPADVILLHIGTNDISGGQDPADVASEIGQTLDEIQRYETDKGVDVWVILARIISRTDSLKAATTALNNQIQLIADARIAGGNKLIVVDMEKDAGLIYSIDSSPPYSGDMYDKLHPNISGYEKMAVKWFDGLLTILPQANAGTNQNVDEKTLVTLDGSWSIDPDAPDGNPSPLDYLWVQQSGTSVELSNPAIPKPSFTAPAVGLNGEDLKFKLTVTDADGFYNSDTVLINVKNVIVPPSADAGSDQNVVAGRTVMLDGSKSLDPDGTISSVLWKQDPGDTHQVVLTAPNEMTTEFTAPAVDTDGEILRFTLTVTDNDNSTNSDTVAITVYKPEPPVADAGVDQKVGEGKTVTLNGSNSDDPDGTISSFQWTQVSGKNQVSLTTPDEKETTFTAPAVDAGGDVLTFRLTVTDIDGLVSSDTVSVTVYLPQPPVADAGPDQSVTEGQTVTLDGSNSYDPNETNIAVQWKQLTGSTQVVLNTPNELTTEFTAPEVGADRDELTFKLTINDDDGLTSEDEVRVTITPAAVSAASSSGGGGGGGGCFIQAVME